MWFVGDARPVREWRRNALFISRLSPTDLSLDRSLLNNPTICHQNNILVHEQIFNYEIHQTRTKTCQNVIL